MIITPNMSLETPEVGDADYPGSVSNSFDNIDTHDHTAGAGVQIPTGGIVDLAITSGKLAANSVTTAKIVDLNVTAGKLADNSVGTTKIIDSSVTNAKLAPLGQQTATMGVLFFSTQSATFVTATGLSLSITTTGRPVMLMLTSNSLTDSYIGFLNPTGNQDTTGYVRFGRNGGDLAAFAFSSQVTSTASSTSTTTPVSPPAPAYTTTTTTTISTSNRINIPASLTFIDTPAAGTYTYTFDLRVNPPMSGTTGTIYVSAAKLIAFEL